MIINCFANKAQKKKHQVLWFLLYRSCDCFCFEARLSEDIFVKRREWREKRMINFTFEIIIISELIIYFKPTLRKVNGTVNVLLMNKRVSWTPNLMFIYSEYKISLFIDHFTPAATVEATSNRTSSCIGSKLDTIKTKIKTRRRSTVK